LAQEIDNKAIHRWGLPRCGRTRAKELLVDVDKELARIGPRVGNAQLARAGDVLDRDRSAVEVRVRLSSGETIKAIRLRVELAKQIVE